MIKPGVRLCDIDKCARDIIAEGGYTVEFNHRLGHFIGRDDHEWCHVSQNFDLEVQEGMTFSIEPGPFIYKVNLEFESKILYLLQKMDVRS